jgi:hypothetical protein
LQTGATLETVVGLRRFGRREGASAVALHKVWDRNLLWNGIFSDFGTGSSMSLGYSASPFPGDCSLLRILFSGSVRVAIGTVSPPPEFYWINSHHRMVGTYVTGGGTPYDADPDSSDENIVFVVNLYPVLTKSPGAAGGYYIVYRPLDEVDSHAQRKNFADVTPASVRFSLWPTEPGYALGFGGLVGEIWVIANHETLWGEPP